MSRLKATAIVAIAAAVIVFGSELGETVSVPGVRGVIPSAEARVGRPLTPVSVAGVARRTVRRCAVGVYYC